MRYQFELDVILDKMFYWVLSSLDTRNCQKELFYYFMPFPPFYSKLIEFINPKLDQVHT